MKTKYKVGFVGLGKLGLPCALAVESKGHEVYGFDINPKVSEILKTKKLPYKEVGAQELLDKSKINFVDLKELVNNCDIIFVPIQTPHEEKYEGVTRVPADRINFNYEFLKSGIFNLCKEIESQEKNKIVIIISTVLPGTIEKEIAPLLNDKVRLCYNPFFIAMGTTIRDFLNPEFVLFGCEDKISEEIIRHFYGTLHNKLIYKTSIKNAELIKVAYNTFIGMKIVYANTIMEICHKIGSNVDEVTDAIKLANERLISGKYLSGGMGDGGGCHPRDNIAMSWLAKKLNLSFDFFDCLMMGREHQTEWLANLMIENKKDLPLVILGKSFKEETNLTVGSPSILLFNILKEKGYDVTIYDPHIDNEAPQFTKSLFFIGTKHDVWKNFDFPKGSVVIDPWRYIKNNSTEYTLISVGNLQ